MDRLIDLVHRNYKLDMNSLNDLIFKDLDKFRNGEPYIDDTAVLSCRMY